MTSWQTLKKFFEPALALPGITGKAIIFSITRTLFNLSSVVLIQEIIKTLQNNNQQGVGEWLLIYSLIFIGAMVFFSFSYDRWRGNQIHLYDKYIQNKYLRKILLIENNEFEKVGTGKFIGAIKGGTESRSDGLTSLSFTAPSFIISLLFSLYLAYQTSPLFFFSYVIIITLLCLFVVWINSKGLFFRKNISNIKITQSKNIVRLLMSKFEIINSGKIDSEIEKSNGLCDELNISNRKLSFYTFFTHEGARAFLNAMKIFLLGFVYFGGVYSGVGMTEIIGFIVVLGYVDNTLQDFATTYKQITKKINDIEKLREFEDLDSLSHSFNQGKILNLNHGSISLSHISYGYNPHNPIFSDFSLSLQAKKKTALVGPSGGGKSTLIKLIAGYLRPDKGEIIIDDQKLSEVSLVSYYQHIGYLTQEPSVFDGTVRENLEYGIGNPVGTHSNASDNSNTSDNNDVIARNGAEQNDEAIGNHVDQIATSEQHGFPTSLQGRIGEIIQLAKCEWIYDLPQGLDTEIGERGVRLSGGQKQRLAIAKIMLKNPDIILLDEPTSALDSYNEEQVTIALNNLFKDKTVIIVAHRLQTVKHADEIIYIGHRDALHKSDHNVGTHGNASDHNNTSGTNASQILERGTHEELLAKKGEYYKMVELQSGF